MGQGVNTKIRQIEKTTFPYVPNLRDNNAVSLDGAGAFARIESLQYDGTGPLTREAVARP